MPNEWLRKVPKFHGARANGFWYRLEKPQGDDSPHLPVIGLKYQHLVFNERHSLAENETMYYIDGSAKTRATYNL